MFGYSEGVVSAEIKPVPGKANQAALALQRLGFRILHIGATISVQAPEPLWSSTFNVSFKAATKTVLPEIDRRVRYQKAEGLRIPPELADLVEEVAFSEPPELYGLT